MVKKKKIEEQDLCSLQREAAVWALTEHPNIARLYQVVNCIT